MRDSGTSAGLDREPRADSTVARARHRVRLGAELLAEIPAESRRPTEFWRFPRASLAAVGPGRGRLDGVLRAAKFLGGVMRKLGSIVCGFAVILAGAARAQVTQLVSVSSSGAQGINYNYFASFSADGRFVAFMSDSTNLVPGDTNGCADVFVRDRQLGTTERVSVSSSGTQADGFSGWPSVSADGRYVAFESSATNLVSWDTNGQGDVFVRDRQLGTTDLVSIGVGGFQGNGYSGYHAKISADGLHVAFTSIATNLVPGDGNGVADVFVRDIQSGTTERVSQSSAGVEGNGDSGLVGFSFSGNVSISEDGRYIAFGSYASNLVLAPPDTNGHADVFVRDRAGPTTGIASVDSNGVQGNGDSYGPSITPYGTNLAFESAATNLVPGDTNGFVDIFVRNLFALSTERVSVDASGVQANGDSHDAAISPDARYVAFASYATNLVPGDTNGFCDIFLRDRWIPVSTERMNVDWRGGQASHESHAPSISADNRFVLFHSWASNFVPGDTNLVWDVYLRDRFGGTNFTSVCDAGVGGLIPCPCGNAPSGIGRGCNNSANTGGAILSAFGGSYLSSDSLVFTTSGEKPTALSVVAQWTGTSATGVVFGQGVRCTSGTLKRLYTRTATGGSITVPDFSAGDTQVSVRSSALGNAILAGQSRWYFVYYRDPVVLGGCPASSTFNSTQTGMVTWSP